MKKIVPSKSVPATIDLAQAKVVGASGSNTVFVPRRNGETGIL